MPTSTFFNLPDEKRQLLLDIAIDEFGAHPYAVASISKIVERAGIAKGSIYQYFADKEAFYLYLVGYAVERQMTLLGELVSGGSNGDLFDRLRWQMDATLHVGLAAPALVRLLRRALQTDPPLRHAVDQIVGGASDSHSRLLIEDAIARGELDPALDVDLAAYVIRQVMSELAGFLVRRLGLSLDAVADDLSLLDSAEVGAVYDRLIAILRHGLGRAVNVAPANGGLR